MSVVLSGGRGVIVQKHAGWPLAGIERPSTVGRLGGLDLDPLGYSSAYASIYSSQPWIYSLVNKLARGIGRLPLKAYSVDPDTGAKERLRAHPLPILLGRPYPGGSRFGLIESLVGSLAIHGKALWWKYRPGPGRAPVELWPLDVRNVTIKTGSDTPIQHYEYRASNGTKRIFLPSEVVHFQWWSPNGLAGTSPLEPLRTTLALEDAGRRYAVASFANGVRPSGALIAPQAMQKAQRESLEAQIKAIHQGPDNAFRMILLSGGLDWKTFSHTAEEAQTIEHRKVNQIEACAVYDIPPPLVAILDNATFSNITEQHKILYQDTMGPWLTMIEETIGAQLLWGERDLGFADGGETFVEFDLGEVLRADINVRAEAYERMRSVLTPNEMRDLENRPRIDDDAADTVYVPLNFQGVGQPERSPATTVTP